MLRIELGPINLDLSLEEFMGVVAITVMATVILGITGSIIYYQLFQVVR